jgi:ornithine cyclodeaminase/alanine dehydrogenase-like protein (mu-crystallin family)
MIAVDDLATAAMSSDVIVTCTTATAPFLDPDVVSPGTFIAAVGADNPHKSEIAPELMTKARVVTDSTVQCATMGDLRHAVAAGTMFVDGVHAELSEVVAGAEPGRTGEVEIIIFDSTGTAIQDVASAACIYERALAAGAGTRVALAA